MLWVHWTEMAGFFKFIANLFSENDDRPILPVYNTLSDSEDEEEEDREQIEIDINIINVPWKTEEEFVRYVYECATLKGAITNVSTEHFYFDMFMTTELDPDMDKKIHVYWMPRYHPYFHMIRHTNEEETNPRFPSFDYYRGSVLYRSHIVDTAVKTAIGLCKKYNLITEAIDEVPDLINGENETTTATEDVAT